MSVKETSIKCDDCETTIGNTLYEIGQVRLCAICWLGKEEGSKPKYQQFDGAWTEEKLAAFKAKPYKEDRSDVSDWLWNHKDSKWIRKEVVPNGDPL